MAHPSFACSNPSSHAPLLGHPTKVVVTASRQPNVRFPLQRHLHRVVQHHVHVFVKSDNEATHAHVRRRIQPHFYPLPSLEKAKDEVLWGGPKCEGAERVISKRQAGKNHFQQNERKWLACMHTLSIGQRERTKAKQVSIHHSRHMSQPTRNTRRHQNRAAGSTLQATLPAQYKEQRKKKRKGQDVEEYNIVKRTIGCSIIFCTRDPMVPGSPQAGPEIEVQAMSDTAHLLRCQRHYGGPPAMTRGSGHSR